MATERNKSSSTSEIPREFVTNMDSEESGWWFCTGPGNLHCKGLATSCLQVDTREGAGESMEGRELNSRLADRKPGFEPQLC